MDFFPEQATLSSSKDGVVANRCLPNTQADLISKQAKWEMVQKASPANLFDVLNDGSLQTLKSEITRMRAELAPLNATLTPENPKVKKVQGQIDELEKALADEEASVIKRVHSDYEEALSRQKKLTGAYNAQTHSVAAEADKSSQYAMLKREVELDQTLYNNLLQQSNQAALMALAPTSTIRVVDAATAPRIPSSPTPPTDIRQVGSWRRRTLGYGLLFLREKTRLKKPREALRQKPRLHPYPSLGSLNSGVIRFCYRSRSRLAGFSRRCPGGAGKKTWTRRNKTPILRFLERTNHLPICRSLSARLWCLSFAPNRVHTTPFMS